MEKRMGEAIVHHRFIDSATILPGGAFGSRTTPDMAMADMLQP